MSHIETVFKSSDFIKTVYKNSICYMREPSITRKHSNNYEELIQAIQFLTGDDFTRHPSNFIANQYDSVLSLHLDTDFKEDETYTCLCSCDKCHDLYPVYHIPTHTYLAVGSVCITKFINNDFECKLKCKQRNGVCKKCEEPLCMKTSKHVSKNYNKDNKQVCNDCMETTLFLSKSNIDYFRDKKGIAIERLEKVSNTKNIWVYYGELPEYLHDYELTYIKIDYKYKDDVKLEYPYKIAWDAEKKSWYCRKKDKTLIDSFIRMLCNL